MASARELDAFFFVFMCVKGLCAVWNGMRYWLLFMIMLREKERRFFQITNKGIQFHCDFRSCKQECVRSIFDPKSTSPTSSFADNQFCSTFSPLYFVTDANFGKAVGKFETLGKIFAGQRQSFSSLKEVVFGTVLLCKKEIDEQPETLQWTGSIRSHEFHTSLKEASAWRDSTSWRKWLEWRMELSGALTLRLLYPWKNSRELDDQGSKFASYSRFVFSNVCSI